MPGQLIMVASFVGFIDGWTLQVPGPEAAFAGVAPHCLQASRCMAGLARLASAMPPPRM